MILLCQGCLVARTPHRLPDMSALLQRRQAGWAAVRVSGLVPLPVQVLVPQQGEAPVAPAAESPSGERCGKVPHVWTTTSAAPAAGQGEPAETHASGARRPGCGSAELPGAFGARSAILFAALVAAPHSWVPGPAYRYSARVSLVWTQGPGRGLGRDRDRGPGRALGRAPAHALAPRGGAPRQVGSDGPTASTAEVLSERLGRRPK